MAIQGYDEHEPVKLLISHNILIPAGIPADEGKISAKCVSKVFVIQHPTGQQLLDHRLGQDS
jgi:hypothetical protein